MNHKKIIQLNTVESHLKYILLKNSTLSAWQRNKKYCKQFHPPFGMSKEIKVVKLHVFNLTFCQRNGNLLSIFHHSSYRCYAVNIVDYVIFTLHRT